MLTIEQALERILSHVPANASERLPLSSALGRVLAEPIVSSTDLPPWDNSAMDGYAILAADAPGRLVVLETVAAGAVPTRRVERGLATRIMTGAPVPEGADAIVMVEDTEWEGEEVILRRPAASGQHIRRRGSDLRAGALVLEAGRTLTPGALGVCAAVGVPLVRVSMRPRVAILSTGDEVVDAGKPLEPGQIWSSNPRALAGLVEMAGGIPVDLGNVRDDRDSLRDAFREALRCDVVVSTGGVSVGDFDFVKEVMGDLGVAMDFWKVWMKPGKPLAFGTLGSRPVFGLPGNPVSCMVNFLQFVRPVLRKMLGDPKPFLPVLRAEMRKSSRRKPDRPELLRVRLHHDGETLWAETVGHQSSGNLAAMANAHGFVLVDADTTEVSGKVWVQVFDSGFLASETPNYPWHHTHAPHDDGC